MGEERENVYSTRIILFGSLSFLTGQLGFTLSSLPGVGLGIPSYLDRSISGLFSIVMMYNYFIHCLLGVRSIVRSRRAYVEGILDVLGKSKTYKEFFSIEKRDEILAEIESDLHKRIGFWSKLDYMVEYINVGLQFGVPLVFGVLIMYITRSSISAFCGQVIGSLSK